MGTLVLGRPGGALEELGDWELVGRAQDGSSEAFGELYSRHWQTVLQYCLHRVAGNMTLAEDLASDVFSRALVAVGGLEDRGRPFGAWLVTIARNRIFDHFKSGWYRFVIPFEAGGSGVVGRSLSVFDFQSGVLGWDQIAEEADSRLALAWAGGVLRELVAGLTARQGEVLRLRFVAGLSVAETASVLGCEEGAVKALTLRAVSRLRRLVPVELVEVLR